MKRSHSVKKNPKLKKSSARLSRATLAILLGVVAAISVAVIALAGAGSSDGVAASTNPKPAQKAPKRYKPTRAIVVDQQTGELRMPTQQEVDQTVASLATLAKRPTEGLQRTAVAGGGDAVHLDDGYNGVVLARPKADGSWETKCVFTVEEGAAFLGLVADNSQQ